MGNDDNGILVSIIESVIDRDWNVILLGNGNRDINWLTDTTLGVERGDSQNDWPSQDCVLMHGRRELQHSAGTNGWLGHEYRRLFCRQVSYFEIDRLCRLVSWSRTDIAKYSLRIRSTVFGNTHRRNVLIEGWWIINSLNSNR